MARSAPIARRKQIMTARASTPPMEGVNRSRSEEFWRGTTQDLAVTSREDRKRGSVLTRSISAVTATVAAPGQDGHGVDRATRRSSAVGSSFGQRQLSGLHIAWLSDLSLLPFSSGRRAPFAVEVSCASFVAAHPTRQDAAG